MKNIAIIFAGGTGTRMGNNGKPKQFLKVEGKPILIHTLIHFEKHDDIDEIYISMKEEYIKETEELLNEFSIKKVKKIVKGGDSGQDSIYRALMAAKENNEDGIALIHDGVRPLIDATLISKNIECVKEYGSAITCTPCFETVILSEDSKRVQNVPNRNECFLAQAPQSFMLSEILAMHELERKNEVPYENVVDSCNLCRKYNKGVSIVEGNRGNIKITTPEDYYLFKALLNYKENLELFL